jgi:hypothetical protein
MGMAGGIEFNGVARLRTDSRVLRLLRADATAALPG